MSVFPFSPCGTYGPSWEGRLSFFKGLWVRRCRWTDSVVSRGCRLGFLVHPGPFFVQTPWPRDVLQRVALLEGLSLLLLTSFLSRGDGIFLIPLPYVGAFGGFSACSGPHVTQSLSATSDVPYGHFASCFPWLRTGDFLASLDLQDACLPSSQAVPTLCCGRPSFLFRVLPFGLPPAPWVFRQALAPLVDVLHHWGIGVFPYLNDCLVAFSLFSKARSVVEVVGQFLLYFGFLITLRRSRLLPHRSLRLLSAFFLYGHGYVFLSEDWGLILLCHLPLLLGGSPAPVCQWLRCHGYLASVLAVVPWYRIHVYPMVHRLLSCWSPLSLHSSDWWVFAAVRWALWEFLPCVYRRSVCLQTDHRVVGACLDRR